MSPIFLFYIVVVYFYLSEKNKLKLYIIRLNMLLFLKFQ